jgi:hypothetical protein
MLTPKQFGMLKKANITANTEKVKQRIPNEYKGASQSQKAEILKLSGISGPSSFYSVSKTGAASPRVVLSLAQILAVNPDYLTGESDDKTFNEGMLADFCKKCTSAKPAKEVVKAKVAKGIKTAKQTATTAKAKADIVKEKVAKPVAKTVKKTADKVAKKAGNTAKSAPATMKKTAKKAETVAKSTVKTVKVATIDDGSLIKLLESLAIRAKYNAEAAETYAKVKELLIK